MRNGERFLQLDGANCRLHLKHAGCSSEVVAKNLTEIEAELVGAQLKRSVDYAGPIAGHKCGPFVAPSGQVALVTSSYRLPEGSGKTTKHLDKFFGELFGPQQTDVVLAWLKVARESLTRGDFRPGQALVLAGPSACGKSFFQALVTQFLGGRSGKPYRYMVGETSFNSDLAEAEHLSIEDEHASTDIRSRRKFGASLKEFTVNEQISIHAKGRKAITLPTFRRVTISTNDEPENLMILPPLDGSILDKLILLKCGRATMSEDRKENWQRLTAELPALAAALKSWRVPRSMACPRFGVKAFHHPELIEVLTSVSPETRLLTLIDEVIFSKPNESWTGSAEELEKELRQSSFNFAVEKLLYFSSACGVYLSRLSAKDGRFIKRTASGRTKWLIKPPGSHESTEQEQENKVTPLPLSDGGRSKVK